MKIDVSSLRSEYCQKELTEESVQKSPFGQFANWFDEAIAASVPEPTAMVLSTVSRAGHASSRVILLKGVDEDGLVWYTNYASRKGQDIEARPHASLLFFWPELERQIRIEGSVSKVSELESLAYFSSRPLESRLGAWASRQSTVVASRDVLHRQYEDAVERFADGEVPLPSTWGGYRLTPTFYEFWQGRPSRMHDRISYRLEGLDWIVERLSP